MKLLRQSTATTLLFGPMVDDNDGKTAETALTIAQADVQLWKEGGTTLAQKNDATSCTHRSNGLYTCPINSTDTNTPGVLVVSVHAAGALPLRQDYCVVPGMVYDSLVLGTDALDVQVTGMGADTVTAAAISADAVTEIQSGLATAAALATVDGNVDSILVDTAEIGAAGAGLTALATAANLSTVAGYLDTEIAAILADTNELQTDMANGGRLDLLIDAIKAKTDSLTFTVANQVDATAAGGSVDSVTGNVDGNVTGSVGSLAAQAKADVNAEVLDVLNTDTFAEPGQEAPGATVSLVKKIGYLYKAWRNKSTQTASQYSLYNDDAATVDQKATAADDGTTATRGEIATGP